ncbi:MAG: ABC transporter permease [Actinomycetota bacterium]|nr:ABC transporter permease [Actinomycetota bacterium]
MKLARRILPPTILLIALLGAWELYVDLGGVDPFVLPSPHTVASSLYTDRSLLWSNFLVTAKEVILGSVAAIIFGFGIAVAIHLSRSLRAAVYPLLIGSQAVPVVVLAPVLALWLGFGLAPKLVVVALVSFFPIVVTTLAAFAALDADLMKLMETFDASRLRTFWHVELPAALPGVFAGAKIAVAVSVIGAVFAEWNASTSGLGYLLLQSLNQVLPAREMASVVILSLFAVSLFGLFALAQRALVPWAYQPRGELAQ